jgi:heme-degrading monooxygenase HmoA
LIHQLRLYEIFPHNRDAFLARFRDHAAPIMTRHGFSFVGQWETTHAGRMEFAYLLQWADDDALEAGWAAFRSDPEWRTIRAETNARHGDLVGAIQDRTLRPVGD